VGSAVASVLELASGVAPRGKVASAQHRPKVEEAPQAGPSGSRSGARDDCLSDPCFRLGVAGRFGEIARFAQHTRLKARPGRREDLIAKFLEVAELQRENSACEISLVSFSPDEDDVVFLTEVWTSAGEHERARNSPEVQAWAEGMPALVAAPPETTPLALVGGKGLSVSG
jgi:quinol monooxygenase YgiN